MPSYENMGATWGFELEVGDILRSTEIPDHLGEWEYSETDVLNVLDPYKYIACDPQGIDPPVGGEINTRPTASRYAQVDLIDELIGMFYLDDQIPTSNCISHTHIHVHIPGLTEDVDALKRLTRYIIDNQYSALSHCHQFDDDKLDGLRGPGRTYLKWDCGRPMPEWMGENIIEHAENFEDFIRIQCCGKDAVSRGRPFRYAINTYCLKHTNTIEFRLFRHSLDREKISACFRFVEAFLHAALNDGGSVEEIIAEDVYGFPEFLYFPEQVAGWLATRWDKERGKKQRKYIPI